MVVHSSNVKDTQSDTQTAHVDVACMYDYVMDDKDTTNRLKRCFIAPDAPNVKRPLNDVLLYKKSFQTCRCSDKMSWKKEGNRKCC